jgi:ABC-type nitrate/sulfonate/bicarbonate transport system permease component
MSETAVRRIAPVLFVAALALAWWFVTTTGRISPLLLPNFISVMRDFWQIVSTGVFWPAMRVTLYEVVVAFALAAIAGCTVGYFVSRSRYTVKVFNPLFTSLYSIPTVLLFPLYVLFFGLGPDSKIAIGFTIAFFPVVLSTIAGFDNVEAAYVTAARSMGAKQFQMFWNVMLPAALPVVLTGLRVGLIISMLSIIGTETIASLSGLGHSIVSYGDDMETSKMFAYMLLVVILAILFNVIISVVEQRGRRTLQ